MARVTRGSTIATRPKAADDRRDTVTNKQRLITPTAKISGRRKTH